ncbi:hypothetical protein [Ulvibacterium sp.]|uniref:hypothetical protein n=1 Tax=Ulvibacterium sp. TaxID=2665914 RepID=UPI003CC617D7
MEKFFYLIAMVWLGIYPLHAQDLQQSEDADRNNTLVRKHRSDTSTEPSTLLKRQSENTIGPQGQSTEAIGQYPHADQLSSSGLSEMTVYEPKDDYKMRVFEVDSTKQFHLKIYKAL